MNYGPLYTWFYCLLYVYLQNPLRVTDTHKNSGLSGLNLFYVLNIKETKIS